jgi:pimeloyl-ACP methyl ester carboxylesterase
VTQPIPMVLVHGGGFAGSCWDPLLEFLDGPVLAVDLPGRGRHPAPLETVSLASAAESVVGDIDAAGFDEVILVGHSLAGCSMPGMIGLLGDRARHAIFVGATVPEDGTCCLDTLPADIQSMAREAAETEKPGVLDPELARAFFANDLNDEQFAWMLQQLVPEFPRLTSDPVDLSPLSTLPCTWICTLQDAIVPPERQHRFAKNVGDCPVIELDSGHMCMISQPRQLADIIHARRALTIS